ncbi:hypothetical protein PF008_g5351 [Phytophthora fragariae]|uniref:Uncharacterized protein n=1 Tax=Phytophthora fragariae TaxID=53985 RepID=A0A6G0S8K9_9STRA|nr:hypothetical protein PF008_g5351 [Phytophthora fragariae]
MSGKTMRSKKKPIFWDHDAVKEGKSSLQFVLDWLSTEINYNKWRGSDRINGNTKEAMFITSDDIDEEDEEASSSNAIVQRDENHPLALDDDDFDAKRQKKDPVEKLLDQQLTASKHRAQ